MHFYLTLGKVYSLFAHTVTYIMRVRTYAVYARARAHALTYNLNAHAQIGSVRLASINFMGVVSWCSLYRDSFALRQFCPLSGIEKRPRLGGWFCTKAVVISIRATDFVRCREVVLLSEGPLWEVRLYTLPKVKYIFLLLNYQRSRESVGMEVLQVNF